MRTFKIVGAIAVVLAFSALSVATASAAEKLWRWLPGSVGETFTGKSGLATLSAKFGVIDCKKSDVLLADASLIEPGSEGKKDATLALAFIHFEECTTAGLATNSVGDTGKTILVHVEIHNCIIAPNHFGLLIELLQVHLEIPAVKLLILVRGTVIALLEGKEKTKQLTFGLNIKAPEKVQEIKKCEGGVLNVLEAADDAGAFEIAGEEAKEGSITFDMTKDAEGEEPMV